MEQRNLTLALDKTLLQQAKNYARAKNISLNALVRGLLQDTVLRQPNADWITEFFEVCDEVKGNSGGKAWSREDLHEK